jgi:TolB-like protein
MAFYIFTVSQGYEDAKKCIVNLNIIKMKKLNLICISIFLSFTSIAQEVNKLAVVDFSLAGVDKEYKNVFIEHLSNEFSKIKYYTVIQSSKIIDVWEDKEVVKTYEGLTTIEIGKKLGANIVVVGSVAKFGESFNISIRGINVETGATIFSRTDKATNFNVIPDILSNLAKEEEFILPQVECNGILYVCPVDLPDTYAWKIAKNACENYTGFGHNDWYLPTEKELDALYRNKNKIGGFNSSAYWSSISEENNPVNALTQNFSNGIVDFCVKSAPKHVRCVRRN